MKMKGEIKVMLLQAPNTKDGPQATRNLRSMGQILPASEGTNPAVTLILDFWLLEV